MHWVNTKITMSYFKFYLTKDRYLESNLQNPRQQSIISIHAENYKYLNIVVGNNILLS